LKRTDGSAFSLTSIDLGPTADYPTSAVFTGTTADGKTITETFELNLPENSALQPVALTGFNDVTDVTFTEGFNGNPSPTSIEFDNIVVGDASPPPSPPPASLLAEIKLDDAAMISTGELPLQSTDVNVFRQTAFSNYGPITAGGFTITNLDRSDFSFSSYDSNYASVFGYFYDGPAVLEEPFSQATFAPSRIDIHRQDGNTFRIESIQLDTTYANVTPQSATFTGTTVTGQTVTQTFALDNVQGFQTFSFDSDFFDLTSVQLSATTDVLFDNIALALPFSGNDIAQPQISWSGSSPIDLGGDWNTSANWDSGVVPSSTADAVIQVPGTYAITSTQNNEVAQLDINNSSATLTIAQGTFTDDGALNSVGTIDLDGSTLVVNGIATGGTTTIKNGSALKFSGASNVNVAFQAPYKFTTLAEPSEGTGGTIASGINNQGEIVGYYQDTNGVYHGFLYSNGSYIPLDDPSAQWTQALGINNRGDVVGTYWDSSAQNYYGFLYSGTQYTTIADPSGYFGRPNLGGSVSTGINDDGVIVGHFANGAVNQGYVYSGGTFTTLDYPGAESTELYGLNDHGQIVGRYYPAPSYGFEYANGGYTPLIFPSGNFKGYSSASSINNQGDVAGSYQDITGGYHGFTDTEGAFDTIDFPTATGETFATGINDFGEIV